MMKNTIKLLFIVLISVQAFAAAETSVTKVPAGNTMSKMPAIPEISLNRHAAQLVNPEYAATPLPFYEKRYQAVVKRLLKNYNTKSFSLKNEIETAASIYNIKPIHILAAIVGEHVFNVDLKDSIQEYTVKLKIWESYFGGDHPFLDVIDCPEIVACDSSKTELDRWGCYATTWNTKMSGRTACDGEKFPGKGFITMFFNPTAAGKTYGLGQLGPIKILSLTDVVHQKSGFPQLTIYQVSDVYRATLDPQITVHYIAASIAQSIEFYKEFAGYDISENSGLTATLYNLGNERGRARTLGSANKKAAAKGQATKSPEVNYYGWFINHVEKDLTSKFEKSN